MRTSEQAPENARNARTIGSYCLAKYPWKMFIRKAEEHSS